MYTGSPEELRRKEREASTYADRIAELLTSIEALGIGTISASNGRIEGPAFTIRRAGSRWTRG
jgi:hypothetical protein